jgi:hypothetical protein
MMFTPGAAISTACPKFEKDAKDPSVERAPTDTTEFKSFENEAG